jgi:hypothetical protein
MQPFEGKCKGRLSRLALNVIADENGVVWMYGEFAGFFLLALPVFCFLCARDVRALQDPRREFYAL